MVYSIFNSSFVGALKMSDFKLTLISLRKSDNPVTACCPSIFEARFSISKNETYATWTSFEAS